MNLITFSEPIRLAFKKSSGGAEAMYEAGRHYLFTGSQTDKIMRTEAAKRRYRISNIDSRVENFNVKAHQGERKRVLFFNGAGGYGDQILTWPVVRYLSKFHDVHVLTDPGNNICWWNFPFVKSVMLVPMLWEQVRLFDYFVPFEAVVNMDEHQDQEHPIDVMLRKIGIDPATVPDDEKVVRPIFTAFELGTMQHLTQKHRKIGLFQLSASTPVRSLTPSDSVFMLRQLAAATPDIHWLALYDQFVPQEYPKLLECPSCSAKGSKDWVACPECAGKGRIENVVCESCKGAGGSGSGPCPQCAGHRFTAPNVEPFCAPNLRELWALTEHVSVVVAPDSMMVHVAGSLGTPCVGLWGPMAPANRVRYYKNHVALWPKEFCQHSPCFVYTGKFPHYCPPRPGTRTCCDVLSGISPAEVIKTVQEIRR